MLHLGSEVCPRIVMVAEGFYVMEWVEPIAAERINSMPGILGIIEDLLLARVWSRDGSIYARPQWRRELSEQMGQEVPDLGFDEDWNLVHGDPTLCNVAVRPYEEQLVLLDPRPPRRGVPPLRCVDQGKMLQSALGWERAAYGWPVPPCDDLTFYHHDDELRRALFWCCVAAHRIAAREKDHVGPRSSVLRWCNRVEQGCRDVAGL